MSSGENRFRVHLECEACNRHGQAQAHEYGGWSNTHRDVRVHYHDVSPGFVALSSGGGHEGYDVACGHCGKDARIRRARHIAWDAQQLVDPAPAFVPRSFWEVATSGFRQRAVENDW